MSMSSSLSAATLMRTGATPRQSPTGNGVDCMKILVLNSGSSSQKSRLYEVPGALPELAPTPLWQADADWTHNQGTTELKITTAGGVTLEESLPTDARPEVITHMLKTLCSGKTPFIPHASDIDRVGHRVVHGGQDCDGSTLVTPDATAATLRLAVLSPVHNTAN